MHFWVWLAKYACLNYSNTIPGILRGGYIQTSIDHCSREGRSKGRVRDSVSRARQLTVFKDAADSKPPQCPTCAPPTTHATTHAPTFSTEAALAACGLVIDMVIDGWAKSKVPVCRKTDSFRRLLTTHYLIDPGISRLTRIMPGNTALSHRSKNTSIFFLL